MTSPLLTRLDELRRRLRQLVLLRGSARLITIVILGTLLACCADAWWHIEPVGLRIVLLSAVALSTLAAAVLLLIYPWLRMISDTELAREIGRTPSAEGRPLVSSVEFDVRECRADLGSPSLQRAVVEEQFRLLSSTEVSEIVDTRPVQRSVAWALAASLLAAATLMADRPRASLALHRLFVPHRAPAWPREHALRLLDADYQPLSPDQPVIVAAGREPTFFVEDVRGQLPEQITLQMWQEDEVRLQELQSQDVATADPDTPSRRLAPFSVPVREGEGWLRAIGGDDDRMPWHFVRRISPPAIVELSLKVFPPEYTGRSAETVSDPTGPVEALVGSVIEIQLTASKPLETVVLRRDGQAGQPLQMAQGTAKRHTLTWEVREPGRTPFWFELVDDYGLENFPAIRHEMIGVEDREPVVSIEHPAAGATLTPQAVVPFRCVAEDDVGLSQVRLHYSDPPGSEGTRLYPLPAIEEGARRADLETSLAMPDLHARPGTHILFRAEAIDSYDRGQPHVGRSSRHTLAIVTPEEKLHELHNREIGIAETIERVLAAQSDAVEQTRQLRLQWQHTAQLRAQDQDLLSRVIHANSRMDVELYDERRGAAARVAGIRNEFEWNRIDDAATRDRLDLVLAELQRLQAESIPGLQRELAAARKLSSMPDNSEIGSVAESLASAELMQHDVTETLQILLGVLRGWRERYDLLRSLSEISDDQEQLAAETTAFGQPLLGRESLNEQDEADFARLSDRQQTLATRLEELIEIAGRAEGGQPDAGPDREDLSWLADALRQSSAAESMQRAAELLGNHSLGESMMVQAELVETLKSLSEALDDWQPADAETLLKQLSSAEAEIESLHRRQQRARQRAAALATQGAGSDELRQLQREQQELAEETGESALRLRKENMPGAATSSARAAAAMRDAVEDLQDEVGDTALRQQQQALDELQHAQEELAHLRQSLEARFALQQASELAATLEAYRDRQLQLREQADHLSAVQDQAGRLRRSQLSALLDLKRTQSELAADVTSLTADVVGMPAFLVALTAATDAMRAAEERLTPELLADAVPHQSTAARRLSEVLDALAHQRTAAPRNAQPGAGSNSQQGQLDWTLISQIRLLQEMQSQIARRINDLSQARSADSPLTGEQQLELDELTVRQGQAAQVAADLMGKALESVRADSDSQEIAP